MVNIKRRLGTTPFYGPTYTFQAMVVGFSDNKKNVYVKQDEVEGCFQLPIKMFDENSLYLLKRTELNKVITLKMGTKIAKKVGLKIILDNDQPKKENVVMPEAETFEITEEEDTPVDPNMLTVAQVNAKLQVMGQLHDELRDGKYVVFSMSGNKMQARIFKSHCLSDYVDR